MTLTDEALALILEKGSVVHIGIPHTVTGCCFDITDCPPVHFGRPDKPSSYNEHSIRGVTVFIPKCLAETNALALQRKDFLGFKRLILSGWRLI